TPDNRLLIGPGVGGVINYWYSDFHAFGQSYRTNVVEFGAQGSLQAVFRPYGPFILTLTPIAVDFDFYRNMWIRPRKRFVGNFSTTKRALGIIYSGGIGLGFGF